MQSLPSQMPSPRRPGFLLGNRTVYSLFLIGFFAIFSTTISKNPVLPLFSQALGATDNTIGLIAAVSPLAGILFSFPAGVLSDHLGRRRLLMVSGLVFLSAPLLYLLIIDPLWLIPVRFFHGMATAILMPVIAAFIAERFPERTGEMLGKFSAATLVGRTLAPLAGGIIITSLLTYPGLVSYRAVYVVAAIAAVPVLLMTVLFREDHGHPLALPSFSVFRTSVSTLFTDRRLLATALVDMATYFAFGAFEAFLPLILLSKGIGAFQIGTLYAVQVLVVAGTKPIFGRTADRSDKRRQILAGLLIVGSSVGVLPFGSSFAVLIVLSCLLGLGMALSTIATTAYIADIAQEGKMGATMGTLSSIMDIGHSAGPFITGIIIASAGFGPGFIASFLIAASIGGFFLISARDTAPSSTFS